MDHSNRIPLPGKTLRAITEEWRILSGFQTLMRQRMNLEAEHLRQLRQIQEYIEPNWSKSGVWELISPIIELWDSQMSLLEELNTTLIGVVEACDTVPSPDEPEEGINPSSKYRDIFILDDICQQGRKEASSTKEIANMQKWLDQSYDEGAPPEETKRPPIADRNYREGVVAQRDALQQIIDWHLTYIPEKLESHAQHTEEMQACLRDYLVGLSKFTSDIVNSISTAQKKLAEFSSLALLGPSQECFERESTHPVLQPAVYLNYCLGGVPAEPVLGVLRYLPKLLEIRDMSQYTTEWTIRDILEMEMDYTRVDDLIQKLNMSHRRSILPLALDSIGPLLPLSKVSIQMYRSGIKRDDIGSLLELFPIENCRIALKIYSQFYATYSDHLLARWIFGCHESQHLLRDVWRKWDIENCRPLPREIIRVWSKLNDETPKSFFVGWVLVYKRTGLPYKPRG